MSRKVTIFSFIGPGLIVFVDVPFDFDRLLLFMIIVIEILFWP